MSEQPELLTKLLKHVGHDSTCTDARERSWAKFCEAVAEDSRFAKLPHDQVTRVVSAVIVHHRDVVENVPIAVETAHSMLTNPGLLCRTNAQYTSATAQALQSEGIPSTPPPPQRNYNYVDQHLKDVEDRASQLAKERHAIEKASAGMGFIMAALFAIGALSSFQKAKKADENGKPQWQVSQVGIGLLMSALAVGTAVVSHANWKSAAAGIR